MVFERGQLLSFHLDEKQTAARGTATIAPEPKNPGKQKLFFDWITSEGGKTKTKTDSEVFQGEALVGDMIPYFIMAHWDELARGDGVNFRFIASSRLETVGFKLVKESVVTWRGTPALRLRMEPSSVVIRQIVDPLFFIVEKDGAHRILEYVGRTTVYDWK